MSKSPIRIVEPALIHAALIAGCVLFAFPFFWMVSTSVKLSREMGENRTKLLPKAPIPRDVSPYIDTRLFPAPKRLDEVPPAVWSVALPRLEALVGGIVNNWQASTTAATDVEPPPLADPTGYAEAMTNGVLNALQSRITDTARRQALNLEKARRQSLGEKPIPPDSVLSGQLSAEAIQGGAEAIVENAKGLIDQTVLTQVFDQCYRRFLLGNVRVRTTDFKDHSLFTGTQWRVTQGPVQLQARHDGGNLVQEVSTRFTANAPTAVFTLKPDQLDVAPASITKVFVRYRMDESWTGLAFEVVRGGLVYRTNATSYSFDRVWVDQELRWPDPNDDPTERRAYLPLQEVGAASPTDPPFEVRITATRNTLLGAWMGKIGRNYLQSFREVPYARYMMTSLSLVILNILLAVMSCTLVGYAFARLEWPGRDLCFGILLATMMIPGQVTMIPSFLVIKYLGWFNTLKPLWIPAAFGSAFFIFLVRQFFKNIPGDLEDAARIDGCGFLRIYWHVCLPLVKPTVATIAIFTFMGAWNNFMGPLIYVNDERLFPLALGLFKFQLRFAGDACIMMAGSFVMTLPIIILFFFAQRTFIQGISLSGTKA